MKINYSAFGRTKTPVEAMVPSAVRVVLNGSFFTFARYLHMLVQSNPSSHASDKILHM
jgi:hypothetical protein